MHPCLSSHTLRKNDRPQTKTDRDIGGGMGVSIGRLREDTQYDYKFVCLSHNTVRGAAGGGLLTAELLAKKRLFRLKISKYIDPRLTAGLFLLIIFNKFTFILYIFSYILV